MCFNDKRRIKGSPEDYVCFRRSLPLWSHLRPSCDQEQMSSKKRTMEPLDHEAKRAKTKRGKGKRAKEQDEPAAQMVLSVEYDSTLRSPYGPIWFTCILKYIKAEKSARMLKNAKAALKQCIRKLKKKYSDKDQEMMSGTDIPDVAEYFSFSVTSNTFPCTANLERIEELWVYRTGIPDKDAANVAWQFAQKLINDIAANSGYKDFITQQEKPEPEPEPELDFLPLE